MLRWIAATSAVLLALAPAARGQSPEAEALFGDGDRLMKEGKYGEACDAFEASNKVEARAGTLIRLGECREKNHQIASAWSAYKDALTRVKDPKKKKIATAKVGELEAKLSYLTIAVPESSRVAGLEVARNGQSVDQVMWGRSVPVNGGQYIVVARAPKHADWQTTITVPDTAGKVSVDVPPLPEALAKPPPPTPPIPPRHVDKPAEPHRDKPVSEPHDEPSSWTGKRKAAVAFAVVAVAGVAVGAVLGSQAHGKQNNAYALCPDPQTPCPDAVQANALITSGQHLALAANVTFGVAAASAIAAGALWLTGAPDRTGVAVVPSLTTDRGGLAVVGRF